MESPKKDKEIVLDFTEILKKEREDRVKEEYTRKARESGYIERKRKELEEKI